jgi:UDP-N-acetylmuramyl pentapeptide synthase
VSIGTDVEAFNAPLHFDTIEPAAMWLSENTNSGDLVLFKGSRSAAMERVMNLAYPE